MKHCPRGLAITLSVVTTIAAGVASATMPPRVGPVPPEVRQAVSNGLFAAPPGLAEERARARDARAADVTVGPRVWRVPVILASYSDTPMTYAAADFQLAVFDTTGSSATGSVYDFYNWATGNQLRVIPTVVASVTLPNPRSYYSDNQYGLNRIRSPHNDSGLVTDALRICAPFVDWTLFDANRDHFVDMLWVVHPGIGGEGSLDPLKNDLWSITSQLSSYWYDSQAYDAVGAGGVHTLIDRFSILPELSFFQPGRITEIGVFCHEFGHALGLPDLYDTLDPYQRNSGPGNWSLMSTGAYGGDGRSPQYPSHPGAWCAVFLGWSQALKPTQDTTLTLPPIQRGGPVLDLWFQGEPSSEHFLVETRNREGFDLHLPNDGLIVYHLDELQIGSRIQGNTVNAGFDPALRIVEADGRTDLLSGYDRGDSTDPFPGALGRANLYDDALPPSLENFDGAPTNLALTDIVPLGGPVRFRAQVRAPGWQPAVDRGDPSYNPIAGFGPANTAAIGAGGDIASVTSELRNGRAQVWLRTRVSGSWSAALQVSNSTANAVDPSVAVIPGGDLAVVWTDTRDGRSRLYYRARVRGAWGAEQAPLNLPGDCLSPTIGVDADGVVQIAWTYVYAGRAQILLTRFAYLSPFGAAMAVSAPANQPGAPALAVAPDGRSYVVWPDQGSNPPSIRFARFSPDSGVQAQLPLTPPPGAVQQSCHAAVDRDGTLHVVWVVSGPGLSEIHYQRRFRDRAPSPIDTTLEVEGGVVQTPRIAADANGGVHLAFQSLATHVSQVRYKRCQPDRGWDMGSTDITLPTDGSSQHPSVLPTEPNKLTVLYTGYVSGSPRFFERVRVGILPGITAVPPPAPSAGVALALGPNPLRRGATLRLSWSGSPQADNEVEFFDLSGRRVARASAAGAPGVSRTLALAPAATASWPTGVYFARVRGARSPAVRFVYLR